MRKVRRGLAAWTEAAASKPKPTKGDQDRLDAYICLLTALHLAKGNGAVLSEEVVRHLIVTRVLPLALPLEQLTALLEVTVGIA